MSGRGTTRTTAGWRAALIAGLLTVGACYASHERPLEGAGAQSGVPGSDPRPFERASTRVEDDPGLDVLLAELEPVVPSEPEDLVTPARCTAQPANECVAAFPRVMIVMDASSSMLAGEGPGDSNWDKARLALAGNPAVTDPMEPGYVQPAFERELEVRGQLVTMEDVFHLGMLAFNDSTRLMLQYTPCASDNIRWAMDPYVSCELPGCVDPYTGTPRWTFKNSDEDREPPFVQQTRSYVPPCNDNGPERCVGTYYNTFTEQGLRAATRNVIDYRQDSAGFELTARTPFAMILITDGATSPDSHPVPVIEGLRERGIGTYVIGLAPQGTSDPSEDANRGELDRYAEAGGTGLAQLIAADESDIADAFADAVARIILDIGTDPCCLPNDCSEDPEPAAP